MSADQLRRAADIAERDAEISADYSLDDRERADRAVAALLRAAAEDPATARLGGLISHRPASAGCRLGAGAHPGPCPACLLDDIAVAYLGEQVQP